MKNPHIELETDVFETQSIVLFFHTMCGKGAIHVDNVCNLAIEQRTPKPARTLSKAIQDNMSYMAMYMAIFAFNILIICAYKSAEQVLTSSSGTQTIQ